MWTENSRKTQPFGKENYKDSVKKCTIMWKRRLEKQEDRIEKYKGDEDRHFTEGGRVAEIAIDLILQAGVKMAAGRVNRPEDSIVTEMIKQLPKENIYEFTRCVRAVRWVWKKRPVLGYSCGILMLSPRKESEDTGTSRRR